MKPRHASTAENFGRWLNLHGHIPWTITKASFLEKENDWMELAKTLYIAQDTIDGMVEFIMSCDQDTQERFKVWREGFKRFIAKEYSNDESA